MRLKQLKIKNFRGYSNETVVNFDYFTKKKKKNDIGKSSVLEALDIFFNDGKGTIKIDNIIEYTPIVNKYRQITISSPLLKSNTKYDLSINNQHIDITTVNEGITIINNQ